ncbi:MAG: Bax inhibitor-1/YccA family protein [Acidimicrobiia bacterium]
MANPALNDKRFEQVREDEGWEPGWAAPGAATTTLAPPGGPSQPTGTAPLTPSGPPPGSTTGTMTANGTFAKTFALFVLVLAGGAFGWSQTTVSPLNEVQIPGWAWIAMFGAFALAMVCIFKPKASPFIAPLYAIGEGVFLGVISKAFESRWDGIVLQAILVTAGVFFVTLALYVFDIVKVTKKFQMIVIGATGGIFLMYMVGLVLSLFGVDAVFWNEPTPLGIIVSVVIACVAALNLFLDYEFISQSTRAGAPKYMEWYGAFGIMVTLVWLYLEVLRLISLLRS